MLTHTFTYVLESLMTAATILPAVNGTIWIWQGVASERETNGAVLQRRGAEKGQTTTGIENLNESVKLKEKIHHIKRGKVGCVSLMRETQKKV